MAIDNWYDGDTFYEGDERRRLYGGDAPEKKSNQPGWSHALGAAERATELGFTPRQVTDRETFGRQLVAMEAPDGGPTLEAEMLGAGLATGLPSRLGGATQLNEYLSGARAMTGDTGGVLANDPKFMQLTEDARIERLDRLMGGLRDGSLTAHLNAPDRRSDPANSDGYEYVDAAFARGVDNMQGTFYGFADALGQVAGIDVLSEWGQEGVAANVIEAMRNPAKIESYEDINGLADAGIYALEAVGEFAPQMLTDVAAGIATGGGTVAAKQLLAGGAKALLRKTGGSMATAAPRKLATPGWEAFAPGAKAGAFASAYMQNTGETQNQYRMEGIDAPGEALLIGVGKAALDYAGLYVALRQAFKGFSKADAGNALKLGQWLKTAAGSTAIVFSAESVTEGVQTLMDELAIGSHKPDYEVNWTGVVDAMLKGGIGGGTATAAGKVASGLLSMGGQTAAEAPPGQAGTDSADPLAEKARQMDELARGDLAGVETVELPGDDAPAQATAAEPNADVRAQIVNAPEGEGNWYTSENAEEAKLVAAEQGKAVMDTPDGGVVVGSEELIASVPANPTQADLARINGYAQTKEQAMADPAGAVVVETLDEEGNVLRSQLVGASIAEEVQTQQAQKYPQATVQITSAEESVANRRKRRLAEPAANQPAVVGDMTDGIRVDETATPPAAPAAEPEKLTIAQVSKLTDDEIRGELARRNLQAIEADAPTGRKLAPPKVIKAIREGVIDRVSKASGITSNVRVLSQLLGRGDVGRRVQQSVAADMLSEARSPAGVRKIEAALNQMAQTDNGAPLIKLMDDLNLRGQQYALEDEVAPKLDRLAASRALLGHQPSERTRLTERNKAEVDPNFAPTPGKDVTGAMNTARQAADEKTKQKRERATRAKLGAPVRVTDQPMVKPVEAKPGETHVAAKDDAERQAKKADTTAAQAEKWQDLLSTQLGEEINATAAERAEQIDPATGAKVDHTDAHTQVLSEVVQRESRVVDSEFGGDHVAYAMQRFGMTEGLARSALGRGAPKGESKVVASENTPAAPAQKRQEAPAPAGQKALPALKNVSDILAPEAFDQFVAQLKTAMERVSDAGLRLYRVLYPSTHRLDGESRAKLMEDLRDLLAELGFDVKGGAGVRKLAAALMAVAETTPMRGMDEIEVGTEYTKLERGSTEGLTSTASVIAGDDGEVAVERVPTVSMDSLAGRIDAARLARELVYADTDAEGRQKAVINALRTLLPAEEFGLRRESAREAERAGRDASDRRYVQVAAAGQTERLLASTDGPAARRMLSDLILETVVDRLLSGTDVVGSLTPALNAVSAPQTAKLRERPDDLAKAKLEASKYASFLVGYLRRETDLWAAENPEHGKDLRTLTDMLASPTSRDEAMAVLHQLLAKAPDAETLNEIFESQLGQRTEGTAASGAANAKGVSRGAPYRGDEELSNSIFGYFISRATAMLVGVRALGQSYKRSKGQPRITDTHTVIAIDAETYYEERSFSLRGGLRYTDYLADPRYETHFWTVQRPGDAEPQVLRGQAELDAYIAEARAEAERTGKPLAFVSHNAAFDSLVASREHGVLLQGNERWVDSLALFRAAVPDAGVTADNPRPSHALGVMAEYLRAQGVEGVKEKDSDANVAVAGKRMPWSTKPGETVTEQELDAFIDYGKNDTAVVLAALDLFDPSPAFVDVSSAEITLTRGEPGSAARLLKAFAAHKVAPEAIFSRTNQSSRRVTKAAGGKNLLTLTLIENGLPREVQVDMVALAQYAQSGEHAPASAVDALNNLMANLTRMAEPDGSELSADGFRAIPHLAPVLLPDSLVIHFDQGKPVTVAQARQMEADRVRANKTRADAPRSIQQEKMRLETVSQLIEVLHEERAAAEHGANESSDANLEALDIIGRRATGELTGSQAAREAANRDSTGAVKRAYYHMLGASMTAADGFADLLRAVGFDVEKGAGVTLNMLFDLQGATLGKLKALGRADKAATDLATVSSVQNEINEDELLAAAHAAENYDEIDESMRRVAHNNATKAGPATATGEVSRDDVFGKPELAGRRMEDDIVLDGEKKTREAAKDDFAGVEGYVAPAETAEDVAPVEPVRRLGTAARVAAKTKTAFINLSAAQKRAVDRMVSTLKSALPAKQFTAVQDLLSRAMEKGLPIGGATIIPLPRQAMVDGAPERLLASLGLPATLDLVTAVRERRSFYALTPSGPVIGLAAAPDTPQGRALLLHDLAHEIGHMVRDRVWDSMDATTRSELAQDFAQDHPEDMNPADRRVAEHEWFANRMAKAVLTSMEEAVKGVSDPVARVMGLVYKAARVLWESLNGALGRSQAFEKFSLQLFSGQYRDAGLTLRSAHGDVQEVFNADGYQKVKNRAAMKLRVAGNQAVSMWNSGIMPAIKSVVANVATRIEHFDPLLSRQLFQGAASDSTGNRAFEQSYRALRGRIRVTIQKSMEGFPSEDAFREAFNDLVAGRDTAGAMEVGKLIEDLQGASREAGLKSIFFRAKEPPMVFDRDRVEARRFEFERMLTGAGFNPIEVREIVAGILEGEPAVGLHIAPGISVGDHAATHQMAQRIPRAQLQEQGWLLDRHAEALMHWADAVAKRAAWDNAFGQYLDVGGASSAASLYFGSAKPTEEQVRQLRDAGVIDDVGRLFHTNHKFMQRLDLIERVHGSQARQEVLDLTMGALGKHPAGQRMPKWFRNSQDFVLGWLGKTMLMYSGLMSLPEPALAYARAGGRVGVGDSFRNFAEARRFSSDIGVVLSDAAEYMAFQGEQYQAPLMRKMDHWFFRLNGNQAVTNFSRHLATGVAIQYLMTSAELGDTAALNRLNVTADQLKVWDAKGRPAWSMNLDPSTRAIAASVSDAVSQFVQEASFQPSRFQATHWGNNPYMKAIWMLKHFLFTAGSTLVAGTYREMARRFKSGEMLAAAAPLLLFAAVAMPLAMVAGEGRDWIRRLNGQETEFEDPVMDRLLGGVRRTGVFGPAEIGFGVMRQMEWGNGPLAGLSPAFSVAQRVYSKVLPGVTPGGAEWEADYSEALRLLLPVVSQNKGLWEMAADGLK